MNPATILKLVLLLGVVLLVVAIGIRARLEQPLLLLRRPALALRAMVAMYLVLPAFVLVLVWLVPLQAGVGAVLLGFAVSPVLPPWAKKGAAVGGQPDYVIGLQVLSSGVALLVIPLMIWIVYRVFGVETALDPLAVELVLLAHRRGPAGPRHGPRPPLPGRRAAACGPCRPGGWGGPPARRGGPAHRSWPGDPGRDRPGHARRHRGRHRVWPARRAPARRPGSGQPWSARLGHGPPAPSHRAPARLGRLPGARGDRHRDGPALPARRPVARRPL